MVFLEDEAARNAMKIQIQRITVTLSLAVSAMAAGRPSAMQSRASAAAHPASKAVPKAPSAAAVVPFTIQVPDAVLSDLKYRLAHTRLPDELPGAGWDYGMNLGYLKELVTYWRDRFDWRAQERRLNQFAQFKTNLDGLDIHFIHQRSKNPRALPLLLLNGWPSTIDEYSKVIGPLTDPVSYGGRAEDAFDVVIPSMPGFGFSDKPHERGYGSERIVAVWTQLMARLGYTRYGTQGTDIGSGIGTQLAVEDAGHMIGLHLTSCAGGGAPAGANTAVPSPAASETTAYLDLQSTKPQTIGYSLSDSPVGLAAWIVEKFHGWSDHDGDIEKLYTKDQLLTVVTIYWVTNTGASSARNYYERRHQAPLPAARVAVPTGCANFTRRYDRRAFGVLRSDAETRYNVVRWTDMPRGGHFPALEQPQLWVDDVRAFFHDRR
jgi:pimeloyl-ACP methyl ester carboxylesterase